MFKNYIKIAYRNLLKNKISSFVNIFGLSVAIGCAIVVFLFLERQYSMDDFHENGDHIFLVENIISRDGSEQRWGNAPMPLGPAMKADFPQIERAVRVESGGSIFHYEDKVFEEGIWFADADILHVLTFPLKYGDPDALANDNALILSEALALKYFGEENPLGKQLTLSFNEHVEAFTVQGVAERFPPNASFHFQALINYEKLRDLGADLDDWERFTAATFLQLKDPTDLDVIAGQMDRYLALQNAASKDWPIAAFEFDNLRYLSLHSQYVRGDISRGEDTVGLIVLSVIAIFLLTLSCFNYMNISIATAARRLKEIGVRKVVGSSKTQLIGQFLTENLVLCLLALTTGIAVAHFLLAPAFNTMFDYPDTEELQIGAGDSLRFWLFLIVLLGITGLASGAYPAFYISRFQPIAIFRGKQKLGGGNLFTRTFLTFQFILAFITMMTGVIMTQNAHYQASRDWGYTKEHILVVPMAKDGQFEMLQSEVAQIPTVLNTVGSRDHVGWSHSRAVVAIKGEKYEAVRFDVGFGYLEAMGLRWKEGRSFAEEFGADVAASIIINETFAQRHGWTEPLGQLVREDTLAYTVVGVVEDFHYADFWYPVEPAFFRLTEEASFRHLVMTIQAGTGAQTADAVAAIWKRLIPDAPYDGFFHDTAFDVFYRMNANVKIIFQFVALMALLISCMGLFGLASQNIAKRLKEISIRKVLGASMMHVAGLVNRGFLLRLLIGALVATPLSYVMLDALLESVYPFRITIGPTPFLISYGLVLLTATVTIASLIHRVAVSNPADILRNE